MFIVDLECDNQHRFEGWYDSHAEYTSIRNKGELTCPLCESVHVIQHLSTGTIKTAKTAARQSAPAAMPLEVQKALAKVVQHVRATHEDVGDGFADAARAMHRGQAPLRAIYGSTTADDEQALADEGVPFAKLPIPDIESN